MFKILGNALDMGITEKEFWNMTIAEIDRAAESYKRRYENEAKQRATFDYVLAQMISIGMNKAINGGDAEFPAIEEIYPTLFVERAVAKKESKNELKNMAFAIQLKQFSKQHNDKLKKRGLENKE